MAPKTKLEHVPLQKIRESPVALRAVDKQSEKYLGLVASVKQYGILNPINVREVKDPNTNEMYYALVDGLHRFSAATDAGLESIPAQVISLNDASVLLAQIIANVHKIETKPVEYSKQLVRILMQDPFLTLAELANQLQKSTAWLSDRLSLVKLPDNVGELVNQGQINLSNAYALSKLAAVAPEEISNWMDRAMTQTPQEFGPTIATRIKEIKDAKRQARDTRTDEFIPTAHLRKLGEFKAEMEKPIVGPALIAQAKPTTMEEAFNLGVKWALHMDPLSIEVAKKKEEQRKQELKELAEKRKQERKAIADKVAAELAVQSGAGQPVGASA